LARAATSSCLYLPSCLEGEFSEVELPLCGVLRSYSARCIRWARRAGRVAARSQVVPHSPALNQIPLSQAVPVHVIDAQPPAGRREALELTILGAAEGDAIRYPVPFSDHVLYLVVGLEEASAYPPVDVFEALDAVLMLGDDGVLEEVLRQELVEDVQIVSLQTSSINLRMIALFSSADTVSSLPPSYKTKASYSRGRARCITRIDYLGLIQRTS
jgi:hypothetical protein